MSKSTIPKESNVLLPDVPRQVELDSSIVSGDFKESLNDKTKHFPTFDKEYFSFPQLSEKPSSSYRTYVREEGKCRTRDNENDILQARSLKNPSEPRMHDHQCLDVQLKNHHTINDRSDDSQFVTTYAPSNFNSLDPNKKNSEDSTKDVKKSNSPAFFVGQILNRRRSNNSFRTKSAGDLNESTLSTQNGASVSKKQITSSLGPNTQPTQVKTKLRSLWNNMKYGWRVKREVNLKLDSATWLLGQCYHNRLNDACVQQDASKELKLDLLSKIWLTYRINFPMIPGTDFISDSGWGCMLRCGQMMMAQALVCHFLHRDWRISNDQSDEKKQFYKMILRWFGDTLSENCPFSLHHLVSLGENYGRKAGDWYGPTHAGQVLRDALIRAKTKHTELKSVCMYVALDGIVFKQDVMDLCLKSTRYGIPATSSSHCEAPSSGYSNLDFSELSINQNSNINSSTHSKAQSSLYPNLDISQSSINKNSNTPSSTRCEVQCSLYPNLDISQSSINQNSNTTLSTHYEVQSSFYPNLDTSPLSNDKIWHSHFNTLEQIVNISDMQKDAPVCECREPLKNEMSFDPCPSYSEFGPPSFNSAQSDWTSLILFVSVRLGNDKINPFYIPCLKSLLAYERCIGIIGGRPKHALYFIGWQEDKLIHMDPHSCQPAVDMEKEDFNNKSFHSSSVRTMSFTEMDPSCAIGFYFNRQEEFQHFVDKFSEITAPMKGNLDYPVFALAEGKRIDVEESDSHQRYGRPSFLHTSCKTDEDDYILL